MQGKHLFEYAVIRIVPMVEREEFLNVGITLTESEFDDDATISWCIPRSFVRSDIGLRAGTCESN